MVELFTTAIMVCPCGRTDEMNIECLPFSNACDKKSKCEIKDTGQRRTHKAFYHINDAGHKIYERIE